MTMTFAQRLNRLFDTVYPPGKRRPYSSAEAVTSVRAAGTPMSAPYLSQLRSGKRDNPSTATIQALAMFFGVDVAYFSDDDYADRLDRELEVLASFRRESAQIGSSNPLSEAYEPVDAEHSPENRAPTQTRADDLFDSQNLAHKLNELFETAVSPNGGQYSSDEVASLLQRDGLAVTSRLISQLRSGIADRPNDTTLDALAFFFNVGKDHFHDRRPSVPSSEQVATSIGGTPHQETPALQVSTVRIRLDDVSRCVSALADSSIRCIEGRPRDLAQARRLLVLASELSALAASSDRELVSIPTDLRKRLVSEWPDPDPGSIVDRALHRRITTL